jgi:hypothetical protein
VLVESLVLHCGAIQRCQTKRQVECNPRHVTAIGAEHELVGVQLANVVAAPRP